MADMFYGDGDSCNTIPTQAISGTTPVVSFVEMRRLDDVSFQLITSGTVAGTWLIEASNNFVAAMNGNAYGSVSNGTATGTFTDVTAMFTVPAGTAIVNPAGSTTNQFVMPKTRMRCRTLRITFTPSAGAGNVTALVNAKSWG